MFKSIKIKKGPVHAGREIVFTSGETAIIGPNGCGKSLLAEYMAFSLFGTVALRGKVSDYKDLEVITTVTIKGKNYRIERDTKTCKIFDDKEEVICIGTKACNIKIVALLGYDFNVYKMGNYAGQLDILGLGTMKPTERKTALDRTLGIGIIDKLIKYANDIALKNRHESEALKSILVDPGQEPTPPTNYREGLLKELYDEYISVKQDIDSYKEFQKRERPVCPEEPIMPEIAKVFKEGSSKFLQKVLKRKELETEQASLKKTPVSSYKKGFLDEELQKHKDYERYESYLKTVQSFQDKEPDVTLKEWEILYASLQEWKKYDDELTAYNLQEVSCPKCGNRFNPYKEQPVKPLGERPNITYQYLQEQKELMAKKQFLSQIEPVDPVEKPTLSVSTIHEEINKIENYAIANLRLTEISIELSDYSLFTQENLERLQTYEKDLSVYNEKRTNFEVEYQRWNTLNLKYLEFNLHWAETRLNELAIYYENVRKYEEKKREYDQKKAEYDRVLEKALEMDKQETRYKTAADNLKTMKVKIKGYVLPSLQKVSSILLSEMSDGLFQRIEIDPDFNILVEGREICLFSGSEQAMINLALRLGLGQVLTHKAFSVFIGDEIDASMRDERAQLTADCLRKISKYIKQVILISHRNIEADHFIDLGDK